MRRRTLDSLRRLILDPKADPIEVGLQLSSLAKDDLGRLGFGSLTALLKEVDKPRYSTLMRWVRAARFLDGPDDPRRDWGVSRLLEVGNLPTEEQFRRVRNGRSSKASVRKIHQAVHHQPGRRRAERRSGEPEAVLERAIRIALEHEAGGLTAVEVDVSGSRDRPRRYTASLTGRGLDITLASALATASRVTSAISVAKAIWRHERVPSQVAVPPAMPLSKVLKLPPGQLEAHWEGPDVACVTKAGVPILWIPIQRVDRTSYRVVSGRGNRKTEDAMPLIDTISDGCLRAATGISGCRQACFSVPVTNPRGCYFQYSPWASRKHEVDGVGQPYDVTRNGLVNSPVRIRLPLNGSPRLSSVHGWPTWRVDAESADGAMSLSLGIIQAWAEANPTKRFFTIASHTFRPSDEMLAWASGLRNLAVGTTISAWFGPAELDLRLSAARRLIEWGIPSIIWIVTSSLWGARNAEMLERALELVPPEQVIEAPLRHGTTTQELPLLNVNPLGACGDRRHTGTRGEDDYREYWVMPLQSPDGPGSVFALVDVDGRQVSPRGKHSQCLGCRVRCGECCLNVSPSTPRK